MSTKYFFLGHSRLQSKRCDEMRLKVQILQLRKKKLIMDRNEVKDNLCKLFDSDNLERDIDISQKQFYNVQLQIYDLILDVIKEKEKLLQHQRRLIQQENNHDQNGSRGYGTTTTLDSLPELGTVKIEGTEDKVCDEQFLDCEQNPNTEQGENESESEDNDEFFDSQTHLSDADDGKENMSNVFSLPSSNINNINKWANSRKLFLEETEEMKRKKELINAINRLYRKRAVVRNRQVSIY